MKNIVDIRNESGFGLIHVLAVTLIVSIAILGLFMSIEYARTQADLHYHTRSAMLIAQGYLEEIKYENRSNGIYSRPDVNPGTETVTLENYNGKRTNATVTIQSSTSGNPYGTTMTNVYRDEVKVIVAWNENPTSEMSSNQNRSHSIMLQEDYYWKRSNN